LPYSERTASAAAHNVGYRTHKEGIS
jgi:hypothetical protein